MSEAKIDNINFFTFLHGNDIIKGKSVFRQMFNLTGYNIEIYRLNSGYYGYYQKRDMLQWFLDTGKVNPDAFKITYYHNPVFSGCPDHKPTFEELDAKVKLRSLFNMLNVKVAFEHHENLYKITYFMRDKAIVEDSEEKGTLYLGGGRWGAPATT